MSRAAIWHAELLGDAQLYQLLQRPHGGAAEPISVREDSLLTLVELARPAQTNRRRSICSSSPSCSSTLGERAR